MKRQRGVSLIEVLAATVVVGVGILFFLKTQGSTRKSSFGNSKLLLAGHMIEEHLENMRITIAGDTVANWPPASTTATDKGVTLQRVVTPATSPKDGANLPNVRKVAITTFWGPSPRTSQDTLRIETYVSKRF